MQGLQDQFHSEHIARKIAEQSMADLDKEKSVMQHEFSQLIARQKHELESKHAKIKEVGSGVEWLMLHASLFFWKLEVGAVNVFMS